MNFELYLFDFDGTLADSRLSISNSLNFALKEFGFAELDPKQIYPDIGKLLMADTIRKLCPSVTEEQLPLILDCFRQYQREHVKRDLVFFPEVRETLETLKTRGKKLAILSNKGQKQLEHALTAFEYRELFDFVLGPGIIPEIKPARATVDYIWQALPTAPEATVMVGDSEVDVMTAKNAGIKMIAVGHGTDSAETLLKLGADYTVTKFSEILSF